MEEIISGEDLSNIFRLASSIPNDQELGKKTRSLFGIELTKSHPNDQELGKALRKKYFENIKKQSGAI